MTEGAGIPATGPVEPILRRGNGYNRCAVRAEVPLSRRRALRSGYRSRDDETPDGIDVRVSELWCGRLGRPRRNDAGGDLPRLLTIARSAPGAFEDGSADVVRLVRHRRPLSPEGLSRRGWAWRS